MPSNEYPKKRISEQDGEPVTVKLGMPSGNKTRKVTVQTLPQHPGLLRVTNFVRQGKVSYLPSSSLRKVLERTHPIV